MHHTITFLPSNKKGSFPAGTRISDAAAMVAEPDLHLECGGKGTCRKCLVELVKGSVERKGKVLAAASGETPLAILSCQCSVHSDAVFSIVPAGAQEAATMSLGKDIVAIDPALLPAKNDLSPVVETITLHIAQPSAEQNYSDLQRFENNLAGRLGSPSAAVRCRREVLVALPEALRSQNGLVTIRLMRRADTVELITVEPGEATGRHIGIACDIGTTTVSIHVVDLINGTVLASSSDYNAQLRRGADVISRIDYAKTGPRLAEMRSLVLSTVNGLIDAALDDLDVQTSTVFNVALAGNTTMMHLLLGLPPQTIREEPYVSVVNAPPVMTASEVGLHVDPAAAVSFAPGVGSYVGGDITSGLLVTPLIRERKKVSLFMDIGTNGEIVIGNAEFLMAAACSAGPAFEGSGIKCGMRAAAGAIESFEIDPAAATIGYSVIGKTKPKGICGSGLISLLGELYSKGFIDRGGKISDTVSASRRRKVEGTRGIVLVASADAQDNAEIVITEADLENLIRTKAAIYAACDLMLTNIGLTFNDISHVYIAGGFGRFIDIEKAVRIGMLPDIGREKFTYLGNSSLTGAALALLSESRRRQLGEIAKRMTYIDLSSDNRYMDAYVAALFLPHTDMKKFPSVGNG